MKKERKYFREALKKMRQGLAVKLLAFHQNMLIGVSDIYMQERAAAHVGTFGLTIAKEFRNEGIGKLLMEYVMKEGQKRMPQLRIITLGVFGNNPVAFNLYKKSGFVETGRMPEGIKHKDQYVDHIYMYKKVR